MEIAPFFADIADGPEGGIAHWLKTADDVRIRVAHWPKDGAKGTVLMFPGRTEFIEKYGRTAKALADRGYASLAVDWRGQGIADRLAEDRGLGHVIRFADYQHDAQAVMDHAKALGLPEPYFLLAHSMGGCIGLRALMNGYPIEAVAFSAPMWGILMAPALRPMAWAVTTVARAAGQTTMVAPGQTTENYVGRTSFADNTLTTDPEFFDFMEAQLTAHPDLGIGGPSVLWLNEALREMRRLAALPSPALPALTFLGTNEQIVDPDRIRARMQKWPNGKLTVLSGSKHEPLMDYTGVGQAMLDEIGGFFDRQLLKNSEAA